MPGPVPKRSEDRVRHGEPGIPVEKLEVEGTVEIPDLNMPFRPHPMVVDFYESLKNSAQSKYYEPSDWEYARLACFIMQTIVTAKRPSSEMYKNLQSALSNLLVTEGDRRRLRLEVVRNAEKSQEDPEEAEMAKVISMYQEQMKRYTKEA